MRSPPRRSSPTRSPALPSPLAAPISSASAGCGHWLPERGAARRRFGTRARSATPGRLRDGGEAGRRRCRPRRREDPGDGRGGRRLLPRRNRGRQAPLGRARRRRGDGDCRALDRPHAPALLGPLRRRPGRRRRQRCPPQRPTTTRSSCASAWRSPPSRPGSPSARWRWRSPTPRTASSSAGRSAPIRLSLTAVRRCCWRPRTRAPPSTALPGQPTRSRSRCPLAASTAKAYASDAGWRVPDASIQVHGGIGFTWEHDLHFFLKRGRANAAMFGDAKWHRERVADAVLGQSRGAGPGLRARGGRTGSHLRCRDRHLDRRPRGGDAARRGGGDRVRVGSGVVPQRSDAGGLSGGEDRADRRRHRDRSGPSLAAPSFSPSAHSTSTRCLEGASGSDSALA